MTELIGEVKKAWSRFDLEALKVLEPIYAPGVTFIEPAGKIHGRDKVFSHFRESCENLIDCRFVFDDRLETVSHDRAYLVWSMQFRHRKLSGGRQITTSGISLLKFTDQIELHRDWFDLGQTVYEHVPIIGSVIRLIKGKMQHREQS